MPYESSSAQSRESSLSHLVENARLHWAGPGGSPAPLNETSRPRPLSLHRRCSRGEDGTAGNFGRTGGGVGSGLARLRPRTRWNRSPRIWAYERTW